MYNSVYKLINEDYKNVRNLGYFDNSTRFYRFIRKYAIKKSYSYLPTHMNSQDIFEFMVTLLKTVYQFQLIIFFNANIKSTDFKQQYSSQKSKQEFTPNENSI